MDALTEALNGVRLRGSLHCPTEMSGRWGLRIESKGGAPFYIVMEGSGWLEAEGLAPVRLEAGDLAILPHDTPHSITNAPGSMAQLLDTLLEQHPRDEDGIWRIGGGGQTSVAIGGCFYFEEAQTSPLIRALPPLLHVRGEQGKAVEWLEPTVRFIACEARSNRPGAEAVITRLSEVLFVQAVRAYVCGLNVGGLTVGGINGDRLDSGSLTIGPGNWLRAITDPQIGEALTRIHARPELPWKVETLAAEVAMSRSAFAARFTQLVGEPALRYVTRWRIHRAALLLREGHSVGEAAHRVGYQSEAAFGRVFKTWTGHAPAAYIRTR